MGLVIRLSCGASDQRQGVMRNKELLDRTLSHILRKSGLLKLHNRLRYGRSAPFPEIRLTIPPTLLRDRYHTAANAKKRLFHWRTGQVLDGDWDLAVKPFTKSLKFTVCHNHFLKGTPWDKTRAISYGLKRIADQQKYDNCFNEADLHRRYARLDDLWNKTVAAKSLPAEITKDAQLRDSIIVHMTRDGSLIFGNKGFHRLAIARLAKVEKITVVLGATHKQAVMSGAAAKTIEMHKSI